MPLISRRRDKPLDQLSDRDLHRRIDTARKVIEGLPDRPPSVEIAKHHATLDAAAHDRAAAQAELDRRARVEKQAAMAPIVRARLRSASTVQGRALDLVAQCGDREIQGQKLATAKLSDDEGRELLKLAQRRLDGQQLDAAEIATFERLVGLAADDETCTPGAGPSAPNRSTSPPWKPPPSATLAASRSPPPSSATRASTTGFERSSAKSPRVPTKRAAGSPRGPSRAKCSSSITSPRSSP